VEYSGPKLEQHLSFVVETVRPLAEASFEVDPRREKTGIAGSSLGGVASLHAVCRRPETFGFAGVFSPAFWWTGDDRWFDLVKRSATPDVCIYIDVGESEEPEARQYVDGYERMIDLLAQRGFDDGSLRAVLERGGAHHETDWARRLPDALRFLLAA
jgi:predicted alpha/beta superfamily hydrolase